MDQKREVRYWKIAPGRNARYWDLWRDEGFASVGWNELGDLTGLTHEEFVERRQPYLTGRDARTPAGTEQVWRFRNDIRVGDRIVANQGLDRIVGIGTVTGDYRYVEDADHAHRRPVTWDDLTPRQIPRRHGWHRTLVELTEAEFHEIVGSPIETYDQQLAQPFLRVFANREEAVCAFGLLREAVERLRVSGPDDPRYSLSLRYYGAGHALQLVFGSWLVLGFYGPPSQERRVGLALLDEHAHSYAAYRDYVFKVASAPAVSVYMLPAELVREGAEDLLPIFWRTVDHIALRFAHWSAASSRRAHQTEVANAVFDPARLPLLLSEGITPLPPTDGYFDDATFALLGGLRKTPTRDYYQQNREAFAQYVEHPLKELMADVAARLPEPTLRLMETESGTLARILKNDYGRGGAWPHLWAAYYPKGGKRIADAQLSVGLNADELRFGFSLGRYSGQIADRFHTNLMRETGLLSDLLGSTLNREDLFWGQAPDERLNFAAWLQSSAFPRAMVSLSPNEALAMSKQELAEAIASAFTDLYPLVLLATLDDPMPEIYRFFDDEDPEPELQPAYSLIECAQNTGFDRAMLREWLASLERKGQMVLYGPPGTGKTYVAKELAKHLVGGSDGFWEIVQFHPAYAYEDFVQGIRPVERPEGGLAYPVVPGTLMRFCNEASQRTGICILIIDEINRANLARVFGELMYLLEYRGEAVPLAAGERRFSIPPNVRIIGTMNTADRSIALVDHALRRRFAFIALYPQYPVLRRWHANGTGFDAEGLIRVLERLNRTIADPNYSIGVSFFLVARPSDTLPSVWRTEIEPYLEEYFFDQRSTVDQFRWERVRAEVLGE
jgi:5-methylcytosine-specific restriction protein B